MLFLGQPTSGEKVAIDYYRRQLHENSKPDRIVINIVVAATIARVRHHLQRFFCPLTPLPLRFVCFTQ